MVGLSFFYSCILLRALQHRGGPGFHLVGGDVVGDVGATGLVARSNKRPVQHASGSPPTRYTVKTV